jgi:hypothetical protein
VRISRDADTLPIHKSHHAVVAVSYSLVIWHHSYILSEVHQKDISNDSLVVCFLVFTNLFREKVASVWKSFFEVALVYEHIFIFSP